MSITGTQIQTSNYRGEEKRFWRTYSCARCGGVVTAVATGENHRILAMYPSALAFDSAIPEKAKHYLQQASDTLHSPSASVVMAASAVDAMLKEKGYKEGTLYTRIDKAASQHVITEDMAKWAHHVRLDANNERHADIDAPIPTDEDAKKCLDFAHTLAQILFVLPARVKKGLEESK